MTQPNVKVDMTGRVFGDLTVTGPADGPHWMCRCTCGVRIRVEGTKLRHRNGRTSCGCATKRRRRA